MPFDPSQITGDAFGATDPQVFWGYNQNPMPGYMIDAGAPANYKQPVTLTASNAVGYLYQIAQQNPSEYEAYRQRMVNAGLIDKYASGADMQRVWEQAVKASAQAFASGTNLAPWDAIDLLGQSFGQDPGEGSKNGTFSASINRTSTTSDTNRRVDLSSESEARAFLLAAAERELGRAATSDEIAAFRRALNAEEKANPETTVTTGKSTTTGTNSTTYVDGEATASNDNTNTTSSSNSTSTGGMDRGQYALDYARSADDYAEYQAATTYMNTLFAALQSPVNVGGN